jgi:hypothetical protein
MNDDRMRVQGEPDTQQLLTEYDIERAIAQARQTLIRVQETRRAAAKSRQQAAVLRTRLARQAAEARRRIRGLHDQF